MRCGGCRGVDVQADPWCGDDEYSVVYTINPALGVPAVMGVVFLEWNQAVGVLVARGCSRTAPRV
jgi:hypothetical protein